MRAYQSTRRPASSNVRGNNYDRNVFSGYGYGHHDDILEEDGGNYYGYSSSTSFPSSHGEYYNNYAPYKIEDPSPIERYVRNRFLRMAEDIHDERNQIRRLLQQYEKRKAE